MIRPFIPYPFEEFCQNLEAMKQVRNWQERVFFGDLRNRDTYSTNCAHVIEYFHVTYENTKEGDDKCSIFMEIYDYILRHRKLFLAKGFMAESAGKMWDIDLALFRAVHLIFTHSALKKPPKEIHPKRVADLIRVLQRLDEPVNPLRFWIA